MTDPARADAIELLFRKATLGRVPPTDSCWLTTISLETISIVRKGGINAKPVNRGKEKGGYRGHQSVESTIDQNLQFVAPPILAPEGFRH